jgi:mRNA interferase MazF
MNSGDVLLCDLNPSRGHEQGGKRPVVVVSHDRYAVIPSLFLAIPLTSVDRGLPHHVEVPADQSTRLTRVSYAMTEQVRAVSHRRIEQQFGVITTATLAEISRYLHMFLV